MSKVFAATHGWFDSCRQRDVCQRNRVLNAKLPSMLLLKATAFHRRGYGPIGLLEWHYIKRAVLCEAILHSRVEPEV